MGLNLPTCHDGSGSSQAGETTRSEFTKIHSVQYVSARTELPIWYRQAYILDIYATYMK